MQIQVTDGNKTSSLFDPAEFGSYDYDEVLDYLEKDGLNVEKDEDGDYLDESEYDYVEIIGIQDLFEAEYDNEYFYDKPLFDFLDWGWDLGIFEDDDILEKARIIANEVGVAFINDSSINEITNEITIYVGVTLDKLGEQIFDELGFEVPDNLRHYVDFAGWLEDNFDVYDISDETTPLKWAVILATIG